MYFISLHSPVFPSLTSPIFATPRPLHLLMLSSVLKSQVSSRVPSKLATACLVTSLISCASSHRSISRVSRPVVAPHYFAESVIHKQNSLLLRWDSSTGNAFPNRGFCSSAVKLRDRLNGNYFISSHEADFNDKYNHKFLTALHDETHVIPYSSGFPPIGPTSSRDSKSSLKSAVPVTNATKLSLFQSVGKKYNLLLFGLDSTSSAQNSTADKISAFFSWIIFGNVVWVLLGTTTFLSIIIYALNTVVAQDLSARWIGNIISKGMALNISYSDAGVETWKDGMISFKKIALSNEDEQKNKDWDGTKLELTIDTVKVKLSLNRWINGQGLVEMAEIKGVRGFVDYSGYNKDKSNDQEQDFHSVSNFDIENFKIEDVNIDVFHPKVLTKTNSESEPESIKLCIFSSEIRGLRKSWIILDLLNAENISGSIDGSLFTLHKRRHKLAYLYDISEESNPWKTITQIRLDGIDISNWHNWLSSGDDPNSNPLSWIVEGKAGITADIMLPNDDENVKLGDLARHVLQNLQLRYFETIEEMKRNYRDNKPLLEPSCEKDLSNKEPSLELSTAKGSKYLVVDLKVQLSDAKAVLTSDIPRDINNQPLLTRQDLLSLVLFINRSRSIPVMSLRLVQSIDQLYNNTSFSDTDIRNAVVFELFESLQNLAVEDEARYLNEKKNEKTAEVFTPTTFGAQLLLVLLGVFA